MVFFKFPFKPLGLLAPKHFLIIWFSNLATIKVSDEGYSRNMWCAINQKSKFLFHLKIKKINEIVEGNNNNIILANLMAVFYCYFCMLCMYV